jgi:hypothetical protein
MELEFSRHIFFKSNLIKSFPWELSCCIRRERQTWRRQKSLFAILRTRLNISHMCICRAFCLLSLERVSIRDMVNLPLFRIRLTCRWICSLNWLLGCDAIRSVRRAARFQKILKPTSPRYMRWFGQLLLKRRCGSVNTNLHSRQQYS